MLHACKVLENFRPGNVKAIYHIEDLGIDDTITVNRILNRVSGSVDWIRLAQVAR